MKTVIPLVCLFYALSFQIPARGQGCASVDGPYSGTSSGTSGGGIGWSNITRIQAADFSYTTSTAAFALLGGSSSSKYLTLKDFGFAIPVSATICGIQVDVARFGSGLISLLGTVSDKSVKIIQGGAIGGAEQSTGASWGGSYGTTSFGGNGNLWGLAWTAADINASNFGVAMSVTYDALLAVTLTANIDYVQMTVFYDNSILGIPLQQFSAVKDESTDLLNWTVTSANDLAQFDIQRSDGSGNWQSLARIDAAAAKMHYAYRDASPLPGVNDYRLHLQSESGRDAYSAIQEVSRDDFALSIYPNPVVSVLHVSGHDVIHHVVIQDLEGKMINSITTNGQVHELDIPVAEMRPGLYLLNVDHSVIKWIKK